MSLEIILIILTALLAGSEVMAEIPSVKSNSLFQLGRNILKAVVSTKNDQSK